MAARSRHKVIQSLLASVLIILPLALGACGASGSSSSTTASSSSPTATSTTPTSTVASGVIELTYSNFFPPTHLNAILADKFCKEIEARTQGRVKITQFAGGSLSPAAQIYDGVVTGISDIGMSCAAYTMGRFPASELVDLPHSYPSGYVATMVANDYYNNFKPVEYNDTHVLYFHGHGPGVIFTRATPIRTLEDMQGKIIRATGVGAKIIGALGGSANAAAQGDVSELLSKSVIDGNYTPRETLKGWKQADVVKYVTSCIEVGNTTDMFVVMNQGKWKALPADIQQIFTEVSREWIEKHAMVWTYYDKAGIDYFLSQGNGREVIKLTTEETARWIAAVGTLKDTYIKEKTAAGLPAADYEAYIQERVQYWSQNQPSEATCSDWVQQNLLAAP
jgi:TRAP-type C4-dicarboxylate transport system substrate-binding protein